MKYDESGSISLAEAYPDVAAEWDYEANGNLTPEMVSYASGKTVGWVLKYDDELTGSHVFRWQAVICDRTLQGHGCPYIKGKKVWKGFNDLATRFPAIAAEWDYEANGDLTPEMVSYASGKTVGWVLKYDDELTGSHVFRWRAIICNRTLQGHGCPYIKGKKVWKGFNDLATRFPAIAAEWDYEANGDLTPGDVTYGSRKMVGWVIVENDPIRGPHTLRWKDRIDHRTIDHIGCPYKSGRAVLKGFNDLATTHPELAAEWDYEVNGDLRPDQIVAGSQKRVGWICEAENSIHQTMVVRWTDTVYGRAIRKRGCPYTQGRAVLNGFNDLATTHPELAEEWDYEVNDLRPEQVTARSVKTVGWHQLCKQPFTYELFDIKWSSPVYYRALLGHGNPYLDGSKVLPGFNDFASCFPQIAVYWHPTRNGSLTPHDVSQCTGKAVWWLFPYDDPDTGQHFDFEWIASVCSIIDRDKNIENSKKSIKCPYLSGRDVWPGFNDLESRYPDIARELHPGRNHGISPSKIFMHTTREFFWLCPICGHEWHTSVRDRTMCGTRCPMYPYHQ